MLKAYNVIFKNHKRSSLLIKNIAPNIVYANNKESAKELAQAIVRDFYNGDDYMVKQYKYIISIE